MDIAAGKVGWIGGGGGGCYSHSLFFYYCYYPGKVEFSQINRPLLLLSTIQEYQSGSEKRNFQWYI